MRSLSLAANSGTCFATGSSSSSAPRSHCWATATATDGLVIENHVIIESRVSSVPARASPIPKSATAAPACHTYPCAPRCRPRAIPSFRTAVVRGRPSIGPTLPHRLARAPVLSSRRRAPRGTAATR